MMNEQLDFFSSVPIHWQRQSKEDQMRLLEQLAFLLLSCLREPQSPKEDQPCQEK